MGTTDTPTARTRAAVRGQGETAGRDGRAERQGGAARRSSGSITLKKPEMDLRNEPSQSSALEKRIRFSARSRRSAPTNSAHIKSCDGSNRVTVQIVWQSNRMAVKSWQGSYEVVTRELEIADELDIQKTSASI